MPQRTRKQMRAVAHRISGWRTAWPRTHSPNSGGGGKTLILALLLAAALAIANATTAFAQSAPTQTNAPAAPTGLEASANSTTITLTWSVVTGATSYEVKQGASDWISVPSASGTSYSFGGLIAGLQYTLSVRAKNDGGPSPSESITASIPTPADGLSVIAATQDSITLAWSAVADATSYEVKAGADGAITEVTSGRSHAFTRLPEDPSRRTVSWFGYEHTLYVRGKNATNKVFPWRLITARTAGHPVYGFVTTPSSTSVTLCCGFPHTLITPSPAPPLKFKLGPNGAVTTVPPILALGAPYSSYPYQTTYYTLTGLTPATTYTIVQSNGVDTLHASPTGRLSSTTRRPDPFFDPITTWNGWVTFTTAPTPPSGLRATPNSDGLTLSWSTVPGATRYDVKLGADGPAIAVPAATTSYAFTGLTPSTEYRLYVHARNGGGASEWKSEAARTLSTLSPPSSPIVTDATSTSLTLSWSAVSGATSYEVRQNGGTAKAAASNASHEFTSLTADTEYTLSVRGKAGDNTLFPWRSITAKTELSPSHILAYVAPTSTSLAVRIMGSNQDWISSVELDNGGTRIAAPPRRYRYGSQSSGPFSGLTPNTEYTIYFRTSGVFSGSDSDWRSITAKTLPSAGGSGFHMAMFGSLFSTLRFTSAVHISGQTPGPYPLAGNYSDAHVYNGFWWIDAGTEHTFYERTVNSAGTVEWAPHTVTTAPTPPTRLSATATSGSLTLRWAVAPGATGYRVKRGESGTPTTVTGTSHKFTGLAADREYTLYVYAQNRGGNSEWSSITASTAGPPAPSGLSKTATSTTITLSWSAVTGTTGYDVQRSGATDTEAVTGTSHEFTGLTAGTEYTLYVRARNSAGVSDWMPLSATTVPAAPSVDPVDPTATSTDRITFSWTAVTGATGYEVKRSPGSETPTAVTGTSHTFDNLTANTAYTLSVRARNESGASPWASPLISPTTAPPAPSLPDPALNRLSNGFQLVWNAAAGATGYEVKLGPDGAKTTAADATNRRHNFTGLGEGVWYTFYVRAVNSWGAASKWSKSINVRWITRLFSRTVVPPPGGLEASVSGAGLKLTWTAARLSAVTTYEVKLNAGEWIPADGVDCPALKGCHTFSGLTAGTYTLYVRAKSDSGPPWNRVTTSPEPPPVTKTIAPAGRTP